MGLLAPHLAARSSASTSSTQKFGIEGDELLAGVAQQLGAKVTAPSSSSRACVGGARRLQPEGAVTATTPRRRTIGRSWS